MDDHPLNQTRGWPRGAGLLVVGLLVGLAVGWLAWRGTGGGDPPARGPESTGDRTVVDGVDVTNDPTRGPADAPVRIVEFSDFQCPFCSRFARQTAPLLRRQYGDSVRWIFVNNPLTSIHPRAYDAALAGECAADQGRFWGWYDAIFSGTHGLSDSDFSEIAELLGMDVKKFDRCVRDADHAAEVSADMAEARKYYILGTPTFFINGQRVEGALPAEAFATIIDSLLSRS